jgi:hypothetical protein
MSAALPRLLDLVERLVPTGLIGDGMVAELQSLAARVRQEQHAELERLEWSGYTRGQGSGPMGSGGDGQKYPACPECGGLQRPNGEFIRSAVGHRSGCTIAHALGRRTHVEPGETGRLPL